MLRGGEHRHGQRIAERCPANDADRLPRGVVHDNVGEGLHPHVAVELLVEESVHHPGVAGLDHRRVRVDDARKVIRVVEQVRRPPYGNAHRRRDRGQELSAKN